MEVDDTNHSRVISYPTFSELNAVLSQHFEMLLSSMEYGMPTFLVRWPEGTIPSHEKQVDVFNDIDQHLASLRVWPIIRWQERDNGQLYIRFVPEQKEAKSDVRINYALFVATLATMAIGGFLQATSPVFLSLFYPQGYSIFDIFFTTGIFMVALMGIIFTHEMGHYMAAKRRDIDATLPYFIPGLPQIGGTFGAFIKQKSPPKSRKDLFDLGVAGPFSGFAITLIALFVGFFLSVPVTPEELAAIDAAFPDMTASLPVPPIFMLLQLIFIDYIPAGGTLYLHPVAFAAWVGCLVTALNLFPTGQLDGGHALRALVPKKAHKYIGYAAVAALFLMQYWLMAILVLALSSGEGHPGPLNDIVEVSKSRMALFVVAMIVLVLCIPPLWAVPMF